MKAPAEGAACHVHGAPRPCSVVSARVLLFGAVNLALFVLIVLILTACPATCWSEQVSDENGPRFFSAHIMQCKYSSSTWTQTLPWTLFLVLVLVLVQWNQTWRVLCAVLHIQEQCARAYGLPFTSDTACGTVAMDLLVVAGAAGAYLIVQYDHRWLRSTVHSCTGGPGAAPFNVAPYHGTGVVLLLVSVIASHLLTALLYQFRVYPAVRFDDRMTSRSSFVATSQHSATSENEDSSLLLSRYRRFAYINGEALYVALAMGFIVTYLLDGITAAIWLEYCVLVFGILLSAYNLYIGVRLEAIYLATEKQSARGAVPVVVFGQNRGQALQHFSQL